MSGIPFVLCAECRLPIAHMVEMAKVVVDVCGKRYAVPGTFHGGPCCTRAHKKFVDDVSAARTVLLGQVALDAIRAVFHDRDRCERCGIGPTGALRDALSDAFGGQAATLIWGHEANVDRERWDEVVADAAVKTVCDARAQDRAIVSGRKARLG